MSLSKYLKIELHKIIYQKLKAPQPQSTDLEHMDFWYIIMGEETKSAF